MTSIEAKNLSDVFLQELSLDEESKEEACDQSIWNKAVQTERCLHSQLAWYKRLPRDITRHKSVLHLCKLLLRINKLYHALNQATEILTGLI